MIQIKTMDEIEKMRKAGKILAACHRQIEKRMNPGVTTMDIEHFVEAFLAQHGATPEQKGYMGYPYATCAAVNDVACHGFPTDEPLQDGDIVTIDFVVNVDGWLADSAWSYAVGNVNAEARALLQHTEQALHAGIAKAVAGERVGSISQAVQSYAEQHGLSVVYFFSGHGIGRTIHEEPEVPHIGTAEDGPLLQNGMVITIEPILTFGQPEIYIDDDGWTARTIDKSWTAQYEHTIAITENGPYILTVET
jgi:methionyl aminopeptidase